MAALTLTTGSVELLEVVNGHAALLDTVDGRVEGEVADLSVTTAKLAANAVTTAKITDLNITAAKLSQALQDQLADFESRIAALEV